MVINLYEVSTAGGLHMYFRGWSPRKYMYMKARGGSVLYALKTIIQLTCTLLNYIFDVYSVLQVPRNCLAELTLKGFSVQNMGNVPTGGVFEFQLT